MKKLALIVTLVFGSLVHAAEAPDWQKKLEAYRADMANYNNYGLYLHYGFNAGKAIATCTLSAAVVGATFASDTLPVTNILSETLANITNPDYQTYQNILAWENLPSLGRGAVGGGAVALAETVEFLGLWLGGNEAQAWDAVRKTYESSIQTYNAVFAEQGQCLMSIAKVIAIQAEIKRRADQAKLPSPLRTPVELTRP